MAYGERLADRLRGTKIDAFIDAHGAGYVKLAVELGVSRERINTIIDFVAVQEYGVKSQGSEAARNATVLAELAGLVASGDLDVAIVADLPTERRPPGVRAARAGPHAGKDRPRSLIDGSQASDLGPGPGGPERQQRLRAATWGPKRSGG